MWEPHLTDPLLCLLYLQACVFTECENAPGHLESVLMNVIVVFVITLPQC